VIDPFFEESWEGFEEWLDEVYGDQPPLTPEDFGIEQENKEFCATVGGDAETGASACNANVENNNGAGHNER
jgi:hypothetical protein